MEKTTEILVNEHKNILKVIEALNKECDNLESGKEINEDFFRKAIEFIRNYADKFHHAKEEDILFKELCKKENEAKMHCNPVQQMLIEHEEGRKFVKASEQGLNEKNKEKIIENIRNYCHLLQEHIYKEDNILYPMADEALSKKIQIEMHKKFLQIEKKNNVKKYTEFAKKSK